MKFNDKPSDFAPDDFEEFHYDGFALSSDYRHLLGRFRLVGHSGSLDFEENWEFPISISDAPRAARFLQAARLLYLAIGLSYYKVAAPKRIRLHDEWSQVEVEFLRELVANGLAEFAYRNDLALPLNPDIDADRIRQVPQESADFTSTSRFALTPVGGGKDSCVALEALKSRQIDQVLFSVGSAQPIQEVAARAQLPLLEAKRSLSSNLSDLNSIGALNGHVPVTAITSLASVMAGISVKADSVFMANERSASAPTLWSDGFPVNHQWSKSLDFERLLRTSLGGESFPVVYASLLRQYSEFRIAECFSELKDYHDVFVSCGRAFVIDRGRRQRWCGACDKCRFVALILSPFLSQDYLLSVVGNPASLHGTDAEWARLVELDGYRPFDCVGTTSESRLAAQMSLESWPSDGPVGLLRRRLSEWKASDQESRDILTPAGEHFLSQDLEGILDAPW